LVTVADVADLERNEIAPSQLAVDAEVEERQLAYSVLHLKSDSKRPDVPKFEWSLLADDLAIVPWLSVSGIGCGSHDGLPSS
jgi:hypothetical protein